MGYLFSHHSRQSLIESVKLSDRIVELSARNNEVWTVLRNPETGEKNISLLLLKQSDGLWGYKQIDESHGPYYYNCPLKFFKIVPNGNDEWRKEVIRIQKETAHRNLRLKKIKKLIRRGDSVFLNDRGNVKGALSFEGFGRGGKIEAGGYRVSPRFIDVDKTLVNIRKNIFKD